MFSLDELNLSSVEIQSGSNRLKPGKYVAKVIDAQLTDTSKKDGSKRLALEFEDLNGSGRIKQSINVFNKGSAKATEIGRSELKSLLFYGGHPNPDRPGGIHMIKGLIVGILVGEEPYTDQKTGEKKVGTEVKYFIDPHDVDPIKFPTAKVATAVASKAHAAPRASTFDDTIPF